MLQNKHGNKMSLPLPTKFFHSEVGVDPPPSRSKVSVQMIDVKERFNNGKDLVVELTREN